MALTKRERPFHILKHWVFLKGISRPNSARHSEGAWAPGVGGVVQECISWAIPMGPWASYLASLCSVSSSLKQITVSMEVFLANIHAGLTGKQTLWPPRGSLTHQCTICHFLPLPRDQQCST